MALQHLQDTVRRQLQRTSDDLHADGMARLSAHGRLLRPLVALAGAGGHAQQTDRFWFAALAIQFAHEASLVHDDVVDDAPERRGRATVHAERGVAAAILEGDHLLTTAYRAAAKTRSIAFIDAFTRAVERTVAGEARQARAARLAMNRDAYNDIVLGKSGELLGCALATSALLDGGEHANALYEAGRRVGLLYQMFDDLLDYCPHARTGKPPFADYRQRRWTWMQDAVPNLPFGLPREQLVTALHACVDGRSAMMTALQQFVDEATHVQRTITGLLPDDTIVFPLIADWTQRAQDAVMREAALESVCSAAGPRIDDAVGYMALHSKSFRMAARFFDRRDAQRVARVYAFCRATDNLADRPQAARINGEVLDAWRDVARQAYDRQDTGVPFLDGVMGEMSAAAVPFAYIDELIDGMRMDLDGVRYRAMPDLRVYTYRVASVVGLWLTRLHGVHDPALLERAERLGHAMQLTNIARDVGEDWRQGRMYLPAELLAAHGITIDDIARMCEGAPIISGYRLLIEELLQTAEADYLLALDAIPQLPDSFARAVAVAAHVYRGIHVDIRNRGYDNLRQRAHTSSVAKGRLAATALWTLRGGRARTATSQQAFLQVPTLVQHDTGRNG